MSKILNKVVLEKDEGVPFATITYNKEKKWLFIDWEGFLTVEMVKEGSEELLNLFKDIGEISKILVNNQKISGPWDKANEWYATDWNPRAIEAGLKYMAVIVSPSIFTQLSLQNFIELNPGYQVRSFQEANNAEEWLSNQ